MRSGVGVWREDDVYISRWAPLDIYSQGDTRDDAVTNLVEAVQLFVESCIERGTLKAVLTESGIQEHGRSAVRYCDPE